MSPELKINMHGFHQQDIARFWVAGINYKKTDASVRGQFAINEDQYENVLSLANCYGIKELFILSTCNRTEIYGMAQDANALVELLCSETTGSIESFKELAYIKQGLDAIDHLFSVGAGLDSQILGDYEIVGQIKNAVKFSKEHHFIGSFMERMVNSVLQSSKKVKNSTEISGGTVSVSFAAVQYIREKVKNIADKKILLIGVGKIGRNTCKNMVDYLDTRDITLVNRTTEKAAELAHELGLHYSAYSKLSHQIHEADIILVATNSTQPTVLRSDLEGRGKKLIIDLSIPYNVEESAQELEEITMVNVDELSKLKDETLQRREGEVPKAKSIIKEHIEEFIEWHEHRKYVPVLKAVKLKLQKIHTDPSCINLFSCKSTNTILSADTEKIQKVINGMAIKMRTRNERGCHFIEAINEYMTTAAAN